eukprot:1507841-Amphidinium_carterae.1
MPFKSFRTNRTDALGTSCLAHDIAYRGGFGAASIAHSHRGHCIHLLKCGEKGLLESNIWSSEAAPLISILKKLLLLIAV